MADEKDILDITKDPYAHMMKMLFSRWKPYILMAMIFDNGTTGFGQFAAQLPISHKVLSENLKAMEKDGLIIRTVLPTSPPHTEYSLTENGKEMTELVRRVYDAGWRDMRRKNMPIDSLGEMWHGYREKDESVMHRPFGKKDT